MAARYEPREVASRCIALATVVAVHLVAGRALVGAARPHVAEVPPRAPMLIQEVTLPAPARPRVEAPPPAARREIAAPRPVVPRAAPALAPPVERRVAPELPRDASPAAAEVAAPSPAPVAPAPPAPAAPAPPAPAASPRTEIGVACPTQVTPEMPRRALQEGISGVVRAQALIRNGAVVEVTILSGPRVYHAAVRAAMLQYRCVSAATEVVATQEFRFSVE